MSRQDRVKVKVKLLSGIRLLATPWTLPARLLHPWDFPGKITGVGCHFLHQGIVPTQGSNPGLLYCRQTFYHLSHNGVNNHNWSDGTSMKTQKKEVQSASILVIQKASTCQAPNSTGTEAPAFGTLQNFSLGNSPSGGSFIISFIIN